MCLAVPARITEVDGVRGVVDIDGVTREVSLLLCPEAEVGEYALIHAGFAISVVNEEEAQKALDVFDEYRSLSDQNR